MRKPVARSRLTERCQSEATDRLDPVLMTGTTVLVDDDLLEEDSLDLDSGSVIGTGCQIRTHRTRGYFEIRGSGKDWLPQILHHDDHRFIPRRNSLKMPCTQRPPWRGLGREPDQCPNRSDHSDHQHEHKSTERQIGFSWITSGRRRSQIIGILFA